MAKRKSDNGEETPTSGSELDSNIADIRKSMGNGVVSVGMADVAVTYVETGVFLLDYALLGGIPESRMTMLYGHSQAGKTTLSTHIVANALRKHKDQRAVWIDAEGTLDRQWALSAGVDMDRFVYMQPESGEQAVDILDAVLRSKDVCNVVVDSLPALVPQTIIDRSAEDKTMAARAALIGTACSKMLAAFKAERLRDHNPSVIFVNQWRSKVGFVMGNPNILPGGAQPRYAASALIEVKKRKDEIGKDENDIDTTTYNEHAFDLDKSKGGSSIRQGEFRLVTSASYKCLDAPDKSLPAGAIDDYKVAITYAKRMGFIEGGGASWRVEGVDSSFKKAEEIIGFLIDNPAEYTRLKRNMIALKRKQNGLPELPTDGYLLGYPARRRRA